MKPFRKKWWPVGIIVIVWFIFAQPYFLRGLVPFPSKYLVTFFPPWSAAYGMPVKNNAMPDVITQIYPWKRFTINQWKQGEIPLWNPYSFGGTPHAANYQSAVFSPVNLLFFIFSEIDAWSLMILLQPLLAGIFMYLFLRSLGRSPAASLLGSLAFAFCGFLVVWMAYGTLGYAALFLPLILFSLYRYLTQPSWGVGVGISVSVALSFLSGHFQTSLYVLLLALVFLVFATYQQKQRKFGLAAFLYVIAGLMLAAPQLFLTYDVFVQTVRSGAIGKGEIIPWQYLITLLSPDFYGNPVTRNDWFGHYAEWAGYIGVFPLLLAFFSLNYLKDARVRFFWVTAIVSLLLALPTPPNDLLYILKIPVLSGSAASRIIVLVSFSLAVLSSFGLDYLSELRKKDRRWIVILTIGMLVFVGLIWLLLLFGKPLPVEKLMVAKRNFILPSVLIALFCLGLFLLQIRHKLALTLVLGFLVTVTALDLWRFAAKWMPFDPREYIYPQMPVVSFLTERVKDGNWRVFGNFGNELATTFGIAGLEGYDSMYLRRYGEFMTAISDGKVEEPQRVVVTVDKRGKFTQEALNLMGVRYLLHRLSDGRNVWAYPFWEYPQYQSIYRDEHFEVFENTEALPSSFLASSYRRVSEQDIIPTLFADGFNRRETLLLEQKPALEPTTGNGDVSLISRAPRLVVYAVKTQVPKLLFVSDPYDPGWQATIDGVSTPVYRADYAFQAVAVPTGDHVVEFRYRPAGLLNGTILATVALTVLAAVGLLSWKRQKLYR